MVVVYYYCHAVQIFSNRIVARPAQRCSCFIVAKDADVHTYLVRVSQLFASSFLDKPGRRRYSTPRRIVVVDMYVYGLSLLMPLTCT